jgi:hypothetical protein
VGHPLGCGVLIFCLFTPNRSLIYVGLSLPLKWSQINIAYIAKITLNIVLNPIFLPIYLGIAPTTYKMDFKVEPDINSVEVNPQLSDKWPSSGWCSGGYPFTLAHPKARHQTPAPISPSLRVQQEQASWFYCFLSLHLGNLWYSLILCKFFLWCSLV